MAVLFSLLFSVLVAFTNSEESKGGHVAGISKKNAAVPTSVDSRFFDIGGLGLGSLGGFINSLIPGINLGNPGESGNYPSGGNFPGNSQFYPNSPIQTTNAPVSSGQGGTWPVIDDASQFPDQGTQQLQYPSQGNVAGLPQYPTTGNIWGYPQYPQQNYGGATQYPQYPNQGGNTQYPSQGGMTQYPNQGNFMNPQDLNPIQTPLYPVNNGGNTMQNQFPNQGRNWNQYPNNHEPAPVQEDGTLDSIAPPMDTNIPNGVLPGVTDMPPPFQNPAGGNAVLGSPVLIPPETREPGSIIYPSSTESPSRKQCVQDCQTTSEYSPVCGSDNITYINPGKFVCARNCGINVFVAQKGRCPNDPPPFS